MDNLQLLHFDLQEVVVALQPFIGLLVVLDGAFLTVTGLLELLTLELNLLILVLQSKVVLRIKSFFFVCCCIVLFRNGIGFFCRALPVAQHFVLLQHVSV